MSRLARLPREHQRLAEGFLMSGGNLKDLAASMDISYPTLRKRLDDLIAALSSLQKSDEETTGHILTQIESGKINAEEGMRLIKEMSHEL